MNAPFKIGIYAICEWYAMPIYKRLNRNYVAKPTRKSPNHPTKPKSIAKHTPYTKAYARCTVHTHTLTPVQINMHKAKNHHYITVGGWVFVVKIRIVCVRQFE